MMKLFNRIFIVLIFNLSSLGFAKNLQIVDLNSQLEGYWKQDCSNQNYRTELFSGEWVEYTENYFSDKSCENILATFSSDGPYFTDENKIDFEFKNVTVTLYSDSMVQDYNNRNVCGISNWENGQKTTVTGLMCDFFRLGREYKSPESGEMRFGIWSIENDKLFLGKLSRENNATTPERRPKEYDQRYYIKQ